MISVAVDEMGRPNLFTFATSELSQDAFLCWMAALADHDEADLRRLGRSFIAWLWNAAKGTAIGPDEVRLKSPPRKQVENIDILFEADVAGVPALFLIEDKTETSQHSGQLERYLESTSKRGGAVVPVYFKTGYHYGGDVAAAGAGYTVIGLKQWVEFLTAQLVLNDILDDYRAFVSDMLAKREEALALLSAPLGFHEFKHAFVQHEFLCMLADRCPETIGGSETKCGTNMGGSPWTQHRFVALSAALPGGVSEYIFHRIDKRQDDEGQTAYYLSTRQYASVKGKPEAKLAKRERLVVHRKSFVEGVRDAQTGLVFAKPAGDFKGANESEIGILFFSEGPNSTTSVLDTFPAVHRAFVERLRQTLRV